MLFEEYFKWEIKFQNYVPLKVSCDKLEGSSPHKGEIVIWIPKTSEEIIVPHYYLGVYYPKSRYLNEHNTDKFTQVVKQFKPFSGIPLEYTKKATKKIAECVEILLASEKVKVDIIIPVPSHSPKKISLSLQELTKIISKYLGAENGTNLIERSISIPDHNADDIRRLAHEQYNTLKVHPLVTGKDVLLIDDILTSGNTIAACVKKLKDSRARNIYVLTVGRTKPD